jgi:transcriptional regulator with XRE-family HTH domain
VSTSGQHSYRPTSAAHPQTVDRALAFGQAVQARRKALRLTQERLAQRVGVDRQSINRWENGAHSPSLHQLLRLSDGLGVPLSQLLAAAEAYAAGQLTTPLEIQAAGRPATEETS